MARTARTPVADNGPPDKKSVKINEGGALHRATFASDEYTGGFKIRVAGPTPNRFANKKIPVHRKDGTVTEVQLLGLSYYDPEWRDEATDGHVALYDMERQKRIDKDDIPF